VGDDVGVLDEVLVGDELADEEGELEGDGLPDCDGLPEDDGLLELDAVGEHVGVPDPPPEVPLLPWPAPDGEMPPLLPPLVPE
jgi:hypothetical protein